MGPCEVQKITGKTGAPFVFAELSFEISTHQAATRKRNGP